MTGFEQVYLRLPVAAQNALCSLYGHNLIKRRYGEAYRQLEMDVLARDTWSAEKLRDLSCRRIQSTIRYAADHVPYYRRLFLESGVNPEKICSPDDLALLPVLDKGTVQADLRDFYSGEYRRMDCSTVHTSGTTGAGLVFPLTLEAEREQWAVWWRYRSRFGIDRRRTWYAHFYGKSIVPLKQKRPPFWRVNRPGHQILFSGYHMSHANLPHYVEELNRTRPPWIQGYPSLLAVLAGFILESGAKIEYRPDIVTVGAESLLPHQKESIEKAFGARCRQHYGMTEGVANISECPEGNLHVDEDYACVEFLPMEKDTYRIIGTGCTNFAFPLIRYDTGDVARLSKGPASCPCGLPGRLVESIDGRIEDYVMTPDGRRIGRMDHIFKDMVNIRACQVYQDVPERIVFRIVRSAGYGSEDERGLMREARTRLGEEIDIQVDYVKEIERTAAGKLRFVVSELKGAKIGHCDRSQV